MVENLVIIGSGPAGYTAAIYAGRAQLQPVVFEGFAVGGVSGGQLMTTTEVENFPGFPEGITGPKLMQQMRQQPLRWGAKSIADDVVKVDFQQHPFTIATHGDEVLRWLRVRNTLTKSVSELPVSGLFYAIGHTPNTQLFQGQLTLDRAGYIQTEGKTTATNIPGVWAAGDVQQR